MNSTNKFFSFSCNRAQGQEFGHLEGAKQQTYHLSSLQPEKQCLDLRQCHWMGVWKQFKVLEKILILISVTVETYLTYFLKNYILRNQLQDNYSKSANMSANYTRNIPYTIQTMKVILKSLFGLQSEFGQKNRFSPLQRVDWSIEYDRLITLIKVRQLKLDSIN